MDRSQSDAHGATPDERFGRRSVLKRLTAMGVAGFTAFGLSHSTNRTAAQDSTPQLTSDFEKVKGDSLFVQLAEGGS